MGLLAGDMNCGVAFNEIFRRSNVLLRLLVSLSVHVVLQFCGDPVPCKTKVFIHVL